MQTDNSIAIAVSLAVVVAFQQWKQRSDASKLYRLGRMALVALATGGAAFATSYAVQSYNNAKSRKNQIDNIMAQAIKSPFIGAILADEPQYQQKLRAAIALNNGSGRALIADMRNRYAKPTFWAASDDAIMAAFDESAKMRDDLAQQSLRLCSEFIMTGIQNLNEVAPQGQIVYNALLKALDNVYQEGKGQSPKATPLKAEQISAIFSLAGFTQDEVNSLNNKGSDEARCSAGGKIYSVIGKLKPEYKPLYARYMLSQG